MKSLVGILLGIVLTAAGVAMAADPVALRMESFTVPPSSQPLAFLDVKNLQDTPYQGSVAVKGPPAWRIIPSQREISLQPGELKRVPFTIERGVSREVNSYPFEVSATGAGATVVRRQDVACASAPYYKPTIDGDPSDWKDAVPITFTSGGKKTIVSTYWNRRQFSMLIGVEENVLIPYGERPSVAACDAVQVAISPQNTSTGTSPDDEAVRFEFLFVSTGEGTAGRCFQLARPGMKLAEGQEPRDLEPLELKTAQVAVARKPPMTYYECSISFRPMRDKIRPTEGREFCLSVLVHDCDGTGVRDWGQAAGLWPWQRNRLAWSQWRGAKWGEKPPFDNKLHWGLCTSKY